MSRAYALIPAAGAGVRMGGASPKQYLDIAGRPLLWHTLNALCGHARVEHVFLVLAADDTLFARYDWGNFAARLTPLYCGGATRAASVFNGLLATRDVMAENDWILVHDAVRPCLRAAVIDRLSAELEGDHTGGLLAVPLSDTLKRASPDVRVVRTEPREDLWLAQTPQMFRYWLLLEALRRSDPGAVTDEASAIEALGLKPKLVAGDPHNIKVTYPEDLALARLILATRGSSMRIGQGFDVHALVAGRKLIIGGVDIPYEKGLEGHSDADVLIHALCDALLGAAGLGDIGTHFPDSDPHFKGIDSRKLLFEVRQLVRERGFHVANVDTTIIAQAPRMAPHIPVMRANIAADLGIEVDAVNVKAKTAERLGFLGRGEGIAAEAIALLTSHE